MGALQIFTLIAVAQVEVRIEVDAPARTALVSGRFSQGFRPPNPVNLAFIREVAGHRSLAARIGPIDLTDSGGKPVPLRKLMDGEYVAAGEFRTWKYVVDLAPPANPAGYAHASWIGDSSGVLMLDDLLPRFAEKRVRLSGMVDLMLPEGWAQHSADNVATIDHLPNTVIYIGKGHRTVDVAVGIKLILNGEWHFSDNEAAEMAREIFSEYSKMLGELPNAAYLIALQRFPTNDAPGRWEAETRGRTVMIFSSDMPFRTQSLQRLHEQLRHEIFHLWFPNGVDLIGDYAWFYEGFAMYSSLKLAVKLNRIRFEDFLDTLGRAHTIDTNSRPRKALTDPTIDPTVRYARGMTVAFLTDLKLIGNSRGKGDVGDSLKALFRQYLRGGDGLTATKAVVTDAAFMDKYVEGSETVDWASDLLFAGIDSKQLGRTTNLSVASKLNGRQKEILDRLGYNNWRKLGIKK